MTIKSVRRHVLELVGLKVHLHDLFLGHAGIQQVLDHQLQHTGFSAAAYAGNDLNGLYVLKGDQFIQIEISVFIDARRRHSTHSFALTA